MAAGVSLPRVTTSTAFALFGKKADATRGARKRRRCMMCVMGLLSRDWCVCVWQTCCRRRTWKRLLRCSRHTTRAAVRYAATMGARVLLACSRLLGARAARRLESTPCGASSTASLRMSDDSTKCISCMLLASAAAGTTCGGTCGTASCRRRGGTHQQPPQPQPQPRASTTSTEHRNDILHCGLAPTSHANIREVLREPH